MNTPHQYVPLSWDVVLLIKAGKMAGPYPEDFNGPGFMPLRPTLALPGTPEKIIVFAERYRNRERLFHPDDATFFGSIKDLY